MTEPFFIINPNANTGRIGKNLEYYLGIIKNYFGSFDYRVTQFPRHEVEIAKKAIEQGYKYIVAVGGDGTETNVGDILVGTDVQLGLLSGGSMNDWNQTHSIPYHFETSLQILSDNHTERFAALQCTGDKTYYAFDMADGGFTGAAASAAHHEAKWLKNGERKYLYLALKYILKFKNRKCTVTIDDRDPIIVPRLSCIFAGLGNEIVGFHVLPGNAYLSRKNKDFGIILLHNRKSVGRIPLLAKATKSKHVGEKGVWLSRGRKVTIETDNPMPWEAEGEIFNYRSNKTVIEYVDEAITVVVPKDRSYENNINEEIYRQSFDSSFRKNKMHLRN